MCAFIDIPMEHVTIDLPATIQAVLPPHVNMHPASNQELVCHLCNKTLCSRSSLRRHMEDKHVVTGTEFRCVPCNRAYSSRNSLMKHRYTYHKNQAGNLLPEVVDVEKGGSVISLVTIGGPYVLHKPSMVTSDHGSNQPSSPNNSSSNLFHSSVDNLRSHLHHGHPQSNDHEFTSTITIKKDEAI